MRQYIWNITFQHHKISDFIKNCLIFFIRMKYQESALLALKPYIPIPLFCYSSTFDVFLINLTVPNKQFFVAIQ